LNLDFLKLDKPIIFFDLETTGTKAHLDRIVEVSAVKFSPNKTEEFKTIRLNPEMPIPKEATEVHGITNEDVKNSPNFKKIAKSLYDFFGDCHLGGFGITYFDAIVLQNEFKRAGIDFEIERRALIDAKKIYHKHEPRDLTSALKFYCGKDIENAHSAKGDVEAAIEVLIGQFEKYKSELPSDIYELSDYCLGKESDSIDRDGKFKWHNSDVVINFGKHTGKTLKYLVENEQDYLEWIMQGNFSKEIKDLIANAIQGNYPTQKQSKR
ncbi:MAG: 3'-5' exonuclease, partial [Candidatus Melainabacteria bacterium]|nr:3'-5' exonuclease [Candidatus Melainabacteria bacterium]